MGPATCERSDSPNLHRGYGVLFHKNALFFRVNNPRTAELTSPPTRNRGKRTPKNDCSKSFLNSRQCFRQSLIASLVSVGCPIFQSRVSSYTVCPFSQRMCCKQYYCMWGQEKPTGNAWRGLCPRHMLPQWPTHATACESRGKSVQRISFWFPAVNLPLNSYHITTRGDLQALSKKAITTELS